MAARVRDPGIGQLEFLNPVEAADFSLPENVNPDELTNMSHLVWAISDHADLPMGYTSLGMLACVEPPVLERTLYIPRARAIEEDPKNVYNGVVFPSDEFLRVARSPHDLANHAYAWVGKANHKKPTDEQEKDRDVLRATSRRAAGHALKAKQEEMETLSAELSERRTSLLALMHELRNPEHVHSKASELNRLRKIGDKAVHDTVETAAINMSELGTSDVDDLHDAVDYNMYGHRGHNGRRMDYARRYVSMAGKHTRIKLTAVEESLGRTRAVLGSYLPDLAAHE